MKIKEKYTELKTNNFNSLILIKSGNFYLSLEADAYLMNFIFNYKIVKNKIGFPFSALENVLDALNDKEIDYIVYNNDSDILTKKNDNNQYLSLLNESKRLEYKNSMKRLLFDRIEFLIDSDSNNYDKIRRFIDEL